MLFRSKENPRIHIPIFGNGDIDTPEKALEYKNKYGVDGIMIGRAAIGNPWFFKEVKHYFATGEKLPAPTLEERIEVILDHLRASISWKGPKLCILEMRRHYANYLKGIPNIKPIRNTLVTANSIEEIEETLLTVNCQSN